MLQKQFKLRKFFQPFSRNKLSIWRLDNNLVVCLYVRVDFAVSVSVRMSKAAGLIIVLLCVGLLGCVEIQKIYVRRVLCSVNPKYNHWNYSCYANSFNQLCSTGTVVMTYKSFIEPIHVRIILFGKFLKFLQHFLKAFSPFDVSIRIDLSPSDPDAFFWFLLSQPANRHFIKAGYCIRWIICTWWHQTWSPKRTNLQNIF